MRPTALACLLLMAGGPALAGHAQPAISGAGGPSLADRILAVEEETAGVLSDLERVAAEKTRAESEAASLGDRKLAIQERLRTRARALYRLSRPGMVPVGAGMAAMLGHLSRVTRLERMVARDAKALDELDLRKVALRGEIARCDARVEAARARLEQLEDRKTAAELERANAAMFDGAFENSRAISALPPVPSGYGSLRLVDAPQAPTFSTLRGQLPLPVQGASEIRDATREDGAGLEFVHRGGSVRAVAEARVAYAAPRDGYGRLVILDHGQSWFTVYGGLASFEVAPGDAVSRGARLGEGGSAPVFFQVRRGTRAQDARSWIGL